MYSLDPHHHLITQLIWGCIRKNHVRTTPGQWKPRRKGVNGARGESDDVIRMCRACKLSRELRGRFLFFWSRDARDGAMTSSSSERSGSAVHAETRTRRCRVRGVRVRRIVNPLDYFKDVVLGSCIWATWRLFRGGPAPCADIKCSVHTITCELYEITPWLKPYFISANSSH